MAKQRRLIQPAGYHIKPKYDLPHFRKKRESVHKRRAEFGLSLTAMIDMFSTLVVFLLLNFSATGEAYFVSKKVVIPEAAHTRPLETAPLISITKDSVTLDSHLFKADEVSGLQDSLRKLRAMQEELKKAGLDQKLQINIQADENTPVDKIKNVMNILIQEGFTGINFAVREVNPDEV